MFEAVRKGEIKAIWIACTNPAQSLPDQNLVHEALERAELVVVQDAYRNTETAAYADVFLPAAGWGEKEGTVTNSERRISRVRAAVPPPGEARADWEIAVDFARKLFPDGARLFPYETAESIFDEHRETTRGRDLDITGLSYALLAERGPQQWPFPRGRGSGPQAVVRGWRVSYAVGPRALRADAIPAGGGRRRRALSAAPHHRAAARPVARDEPHRNGGEPVRARAGAARRRPSGRPRSPGNKGCRAGQLSSRRGHAFLRAAADPDLTRGVVYVPMHWGARFLGGGGGAASTS